MQFSKIAAIAALIEMTEAIRVTDNSDKLGRNVDGTIW